MEKEKKKKRLQCYFSFSELFINPMLQKFFCNIQLAVMFIDQAKWDDIRKLSSVIDRVAKTTF